MILKHHHTDCLLVVKEKAQYIILKVREHRDKVSKISINNVVYGYCIPPDMTS